MKKIVKTKYLDVALFDEGPRTDAVVFLLHGWPDDATTWKHVAPHLHRIGLRTIAPMHRGFGETAFLAKTSRRTANAGILAWDVIDVADAMGLQTFSVAGHDWGSTIGESLAVGWPKRVRKLAMLSTPSRIGGLKTPDFKQCSRYWYQWFQATQRGEAAIRKDPKGFARTMWEMWSPKGWFDEATFRSVSRSFANPDWVDVTLHSYRSRWQEDTPDSRSAALERKIAMTQRIKTPTLFLHGELDGVVPPEGSEGMRNTFAGDFQRRMLPGVGHFPTRENPELVGTALARHFAS